MPITRKIFLDRADRLQRLPVLPDTDLSRIAARLATRNVDVIDLSSPGVPPTPEELSAAFSGDADGWLPATADDLEILRETIAAWYQKRFHVRLNPRTEIEFVPNATIGLCLLSLAFVDHGDMVLVPDPGRPVYRSSVVMAGGGVMPYHLWERNDFLPSFAGLQEGLAGRVRMMILSYPHNPTAAMADINVLNQAVAFARRNNILMVSDAAFTHATYGPTRPPSLLEATGARSLGVELFSMGPSFGLPGLPLAVMVGNREAISAVSLLVDASRLTPSRMAAQAAVRRIAEAETYMETRLQRLEASRRILVEAFAELRGTPRSLAVVPFLWASIPASVGSEGFCRRLLRRTGIRLRPGTVFGERGEGYIRVAIPDDRETASAVADRLRKHAHLYQRRIPRTSALRTRRKTRSRRSGNNRSTESEE